jgi:hypothetical protein
LADCITLQAIFGALINKLIGFRGLWKLIVHQGGASLLIVNEWTVNHLRQEIPL